MDFSTQALVEINKVKLMKLLGNNQGQNQKDF